MMCKAWILPAALAVALAAHAHAETLFASDFQDSKPDGWVAVGRGDVRLSSYAENVSLRLGPGAQAITQVSTAGRADVALIAAFAAQSLGANGACVLDVSSDRGHHWTEIHRIGPGQDDGITLHTGGGTAAVMDNQPALVLRLRNLSPSASAICWADNILLTGETAEPARPRAAFGTGGSRAALTYDEMTSAAAVTGPVTMDAFAPPKNARAPTNVFEGHLVLGEEKPGGTFRVLKDQFGDADANAGAARHLPPFDFAFVQSGDVLISEKRGAVPGSHPEWEYILEPGRVWDEAADHGLTRAAIPFTLEERNANCMHNGVLTFLFGKSGAVSDVAYEIAHETCFYFKFDMWGRRAARYLPQSVPDAAAIAARYAKDVAGRMPTRSIAELSRDGIDPSQFGAEIPPGDMTLYGFVANGVNYVGGCQTRFGTYPYCDVLDVPSYSVAKSLVGGLATMRLNLLYPGMTRSTIGALVPDCAGAGTWNDVTLADALDMATGHYNSPDDQADEDAPDLLPFFLADSHAKRIAFACTHYPRKSSPGTRWVYHTADIYLLGTALNAFWRGKEGASRDFFTDLLADGIWKKLGLSPSAAVTRRTYDAAAEPFSGYGLTLQRDDVAKIAQFLNVDGGAVGGEQLVDREMLDAALQRVPTDTGLEASGPEFRYHYGFWAWNAQHVLGCKSPAWIPYMSGYGGITVALLPNGMSYYYFSDSGIWLWAKAVIQADKIKPICAR